MLLSNPSFVGGTFAFVLDNTVPGESLVIGCLVYPRNTIYSLAAGLYVQCLVKQIDVIYEINYFWTFFVVSY